MHDPQVSIVVPTYNRCELLRATLDALAQQVTPSCGFEVVVADDGSSDGTAGVVRSFGGRLNLRYHYQPDQGFRASTARNEGARLASAPVLAFLDTGVIAGPDFVREHWKMHPRPGPPRVALGYTYGYRPFDPTPGLADELAILSPAEVRQQYRDDPSFRDWRHEEFAAVGFDLTALLRPWMLLWALNFSVRAEDFWRVGGFDESFVGWGIEDLDLGYRLYRGGAEFTVARGAWAIDTPHPRDEEGNAASSKRNALHFLQKHSEPVVELCWAWLTHAVAWSLPEEHQALLDRTEAYSDVRVTDDIEAALTADAAAPRTRLAVLGCGPEVPVSLPACDLVDFDAAALRSASAGRHDRVHHAIGLRTPLANDAVDLVLVTSRLRPFWASHGEMILAEARRIGRAVRLAGWQVASRWDP